MGLLSTTEPLRHTAARPMEERPRFSSESLLSDAGRYGEEVTDGDEGEGKNVKGRRTYSVSKILVCKPAEDRSQRA